MMKFFLAGSSLLAQCSEDHCPKRHRLYPSGTWVFPPVLPSGGRGVTWGFLCVFQFPGNGITMLPAMFPNMVMGIGKLGLLWVYLPLREQEASCEREKGVFFRLKTATLGCSMTLISLSRKNDHHSGSLVTVEESYTVSMYTCDLKQPYCGWQETQWHQTHFQFI